MSASWERVRELVAEALELEPGERAAFVAEHAGGEAELLSEVHALLAAEARAGRLFEAAERPRAPLADLPEPLSPGARVERWRLLRKLGEGGMGAVWLAERDGSEQRVALKLLHLPLLTDSARRRFAVEQRALARLEHPGITRLIDGGLSAGGLPFLAMEHVDGAPIGAWCDAQRLGPRERAGLFVEVCAAVHAAHQRLVVHGDIKPSNVLIDRAGRVKLCDFGIARLLDSDEESATRTGHRALTPRYASPEQVRGEPVTTASDVYSLGALLYELLCGAAVHDARTRSTAELERVICELIPARPSTAAAQVGTEQLAARSTSHAELVRELSGDLDAIVMRCLAKEPERRYRSAAELGDDLGRHLRSEPVRARPETLGYVARRFVRRNRVAVALAAVAVAALTGGFAAALWQARVARAAQVREADARAAAEQRYRAVRELATVLVFDAHDSIRNLPGSTAARELLADTAARHLDALAAEAGDDPELERELARAYLRLGDALGRPVEANLGRTAEALRCYRTALELADRSMEDLALRAWARTKLGDLLLYESKTEAAASAYREALELRQQLAAREPHDWRENPTLGYLHDRMCELLTRQGRIEEAAEHAARTLDFAERAAAAEPDSDVWGESLAVALGRSAALSLARREFDSAIAALERACEVIDPLAERQPPDARVRQRAAQTSGELGQALARAGRRDEARERLERAVELHRSLCALDARSAAFRDDLAVALRRLGGVEAAANNLEHAASLHAEALELTRENLELDPRSAKAARSMAVAADELGGVLARLQRDSEALALHVESNRVFAELAAGSPDDASAQRGLAVSCSMLAQARLSASGRPGIDPEFRARLRAEAASAIEQALGIVEQLSASGRLAPSDSGVRDFLRRQLAACTSAE